MELVVNEIFSSIQGEGIETGLPTTFIRLAGCDLRCRWCDTGYALSRDDGKIMTVSDIIDDVSCRGPGRICITGGEPLLQKEGLMELVDDLVKRGFEVDVETNGAHDTTDLSSISSRIMISVDVKMPSSGEYGSFNKENLRTLRHMDQIKFIIQDGKDLETALGFLIEHEPVANIVFTPCSNDGGQIIVDEILRLLSLETESKTHEVLRRIRVMVQTHKVIWDSEKRGV